MNNLRKAAQAVLVSADSLMIPGDVPVIVGTKEVEALRQALAEPVAPIFFSGPIGHFWVDTMEMGERILYHMEVDDDGWTATETNTPSIDALIAEIDGLCFDEASGGYFWPESISPSELKAITDKYRSK